MALPCQLHGRKMPLYTTKRSAAVNIDSITPAREMQPTVFIGSDLARAGQFKFSKRFTQQVAFLYEAHHTSKDGMSSAQRGINELRAHLHGVQSQIEKIKSEFEHWVGLPYYTERSENDRPAVKTFDDQRGPMLSQLLTQQDNLNSRIAAAESSMESHKAWLQPTGLLLDAIARFFNFPRVENLLPGIIPGASLRFPDVVAGDRRRKKLDGIQDDLTKLFVERDTLQNASVPYDEFKRRMIAGLDGSRLGYRITSLYPHEPSHVDFDTPLSLRDLAAVMGAEYVANRLYQISSSYQATYAPVDVQKRKARLKEIDAKILSLGKSEEREVLALFDAGVFATRRETADPAVLIDV